VAGRVGFRWRQLAHDLRSGLLFRPTVITVELALLGLVLIELERAGLSEQFLPDDRRRFDENFAATLPEAISRSSG